MVEPQSFPAEGLGVVLGCRRRQHRLGWPMCPHFRNGSVNEVLIAEQCFERERTAA
jgi:hypothetical protein